MPNKETRKRDNKKYYSGLKKTKVRVSIDVLEEKYFKAKETAEKEGKSTKRVFEDLVNGALND